jgi:general secretion pathway protein B
MSFILDALRKSESERRRDARPGLAHLPAATVRSHAPPWVWVVMSVLAVGLIGLAALWWQSTQTAARNGVEAPQAATESNPPLSTSEQPRAPAPSGAQQRAVGPEGPATSVQAESRADARNLPTVAEVRASGVALPALSLQLISYSEDASQRFVFINGFRYGQGQRVQNGPLIVSISADSVVLQHQGRDFVLTPE